MGVASTVLTTRPFVSQARAMARLRGDADYGLAVIDHPIVTLTSEEVAGPGRSRRPAGDAPSSGQIALNREAHFVNSKQMLLAWGRYILHSQVWEMIYLARKPMAWAPVDLKALSRRSSLPLTKGSMKGLPSWSICGRGTEAG